MRSTVHPNGEGKLRPVAISVRLKTLPPLGFIKSVRFPQITFFEEKKFQGRCYNCSSDCADLHTYFNRCSSIRVESGVWVIYEKPNYKGFQYVLSPGEYADNQQWMAFNDNVKSCRTVKNVSSPPFFPKFLQPQNPTEVSHRLLLEMCLCSPCRTALYKGTSPGWVLTVKPAD